MLSFHGLRQELDPGKTSTQEVLNCDLDCSQSFPNLASSKSFEVFAIILLQSVEQEPGEHIHSPAAMRAMARRRRENVTVIYTEILDEISRTTCERHSQAGCCDRSLSREDDESLWAIVDSNNTFWGIYRKSSADLDMAQRQSAQSYWHLVSKKGPIRALPSPSCTTWSHTLHEPRNTVVVRGSS